MSYRVKSAKKVKEQLMGGRPNTSRRLQPRTAHMTVFDLRETARQHCERAVRVVVACLDSKDERIRLTAAALLMERGYGKPEMKADVSTTHAFVVAPEVLPQDIWLACRGNPQLLDLSKTPDTKVTLDSKVSDEPEPTKLN
jgi:hypothetical protein